MGGVYRSAHVEIDVRRFLKQKSADQRRAVLLEIPLLIQRVVAKIILGILKDSVHGDNTLSNKIHALNGCNGGHVTTLKAQGCAHGLTEILGCNRRRRTAADDVLTLLGEEQRHHTVGVVSVGGRAKQNVHRFPLSDSDNTCCGIVTRLMTVELITLVNQHGGEIFCRVAACYQRLHIFCNILSLPAKIVFATHTRMRTAVTHGNKYVILLQLNGGFINFFTADIHFGPGIIVNIVISYHDYVRVIVLNDLGYLIIQQMNNRKRGICHASHRAHGQGCGYGRHAFLDWKPCRHHG